MYEILADKKRSLAGSMSSPLLILRDCTVHFPRAASKIKILKSRKAIRQSRLRPAAAACLLLLHQRKTCKVVSRLRCKIDRFYTVVC